MPRCFIEHGPTLPEDTAFAAMLEIVGRQSESVNRMYIVASVGYQHQ